MPPTEPHESGLSCFMNCRQPFLIIRYPSSGRSDKINHVSGTAAVSHARTVHRIHRVRIFTLGIALAAAVCLPAHLSYLQPTLHRLDYLNRPQYIPGLYVGYLKPTRTLQALSHHIANHGLCLFQPAAEVSVTAQAAPRLENPQSRDRLCLCRLKYLCPDPCRQLFCKSKNKGLLTLTHLGRVRPPVA